ncbi:MAG: DegT/DnrJ/EryC1/StrS family aminotransferase [Candidatus Omnitrophota bacterium]|nr:DegT/DnrJ/EryC1/StrS family aminotransferase [Candidatus Omnitrophota bacterium]
MKQAKVNISLSKVYIDKALKQSVLKVLDSGRFILGDESRAFEEEFARFIGTKFAILTGSGTSAIWLTLMSLGIKEGDEIIVPSHTAFPTVEPILNLKARPVFVDIDDTYTIDPAKIEEKITRKTKGIIPVHLYGHPANMAEIARIARKHGLFISEDACQAHGAKFKDRAAGSMGVAGCFSFYPSKNLTVCGDGGIVTTDSSRINKEIRMLRDHGRASKYLHSVSGYNERFNEIQAAIGRCGLKRLDAFNLRRREIAAAYAKGLKGLPVVLSQEKPWAYHVWHMFVIRAEGRDKIREYLLNKGVETGVHYPVPCHLQPPLSGKEKQKGLPLTEKYCSQILSLPMHPMLKDADVRYVCRQLRAYFHDAR